MSTSLQLAIRIQETIDGHVRQVARLSDSDTWTGPVALVSRGELHMVRSHLAECVQLLRSHHDSTGL